MVTASLGMTLVLLAQAGAPISAQPPADGFSYGQLPPGQSPAATQSPTPPQRQPAAEAPAARTFPAEDTGAQPAARGLLPTSPPEQAPLGTPPRLVADALRGPGHDALTGRPLTLVEVLGSAGTDRTRQTATAHAYWALAANMARYHWRLDERDYLLRLEGAENVPLENFSADNATEVDPRIARVDAAVRQARLEVLEAQHALAELMLLPPQSELPLPADLPHVGAYRTQFTELFSGRVAPRNLERIDRALPIRRSEIDVRAAAVQAAMDSVQAAERAYLRQRTATREELVQQLVFLAEQRNDFIQAVRFYNADIAEYAIAVALPGTPLPQLVSMLVLDSAAGGPSRARLMGIQPPASSAPPQSLPPRSPAGDNRRTSFEEDYGPSGGIEDRWQPAGREPAVEPGPFTPGASSWPAANPQQQLPANADSGTWQDDAFEAADEPSGASQPASPASPFELRSPADVPTQPRDEQSLPEAERPTPDNPFRGGGAGWQDEGSGSPAPPHYDLDPAEVQDDTDDALLQSTLKVIVRDSQYDELRQQSPRARTQQLATALFGTSAPENATEISLSETLARTPASSRHQVATAYWQVATAAVEQATQAARLEQLNELVQHALNTAGTDDGASRAMLDLRAHRLAAEADLLRARGRLAVAQLRLMELTGTTTTGNATTVASLWPITKPHAGRYDLKLDSLSSTVNGRRDLLRLADRIAARHALLVNRATEVIEPAAVPGDLRSSIRSIDRQAVVTMEYARAVEGYNVDIAHYSSALFPLDTPVAQFAQALVLAPGNERLR